VGSWILLAVVASARTLGGLHTDSLIGGEVWTARAHHEEQLIDGVEQVEVVEIRGATALVMS